MGCVTSPPGIVVTEMIVIDPLPSKTCNYNCVYCQLGRTRSLTNDRKDFYPPETVFAEVETALARRGAGEIDYITFARTRCTQA